MSTESIFISYSNNDAQFAKEFAQTLMKAGAKVWIESIHGQDDDDVTAEAIKSSKLFMIITSEHALKDASIKQEKKYARELGIERFLIKISPCDTSKFRWKGLPSVDLTQDKAKGMKSILEKLNLSSEGTPEVNIEKEVVSAPTQEPVSAEVEDSQSTEVPEEIVQVEQPTQATQPTNNDIARKASLLVSEDEIETVRNMFKRQVRDSKLAIYTFTGVSVVIIVVAYLFFGDYFADAEGAFDKVKKFFPSIGAILPNAFSGISASKINDKKKRIAIVDKLERTRDRYKDNLAGTSEADIKALEAKLEELITI